MKLLTKYAKRLQRLIMQTWSDDADLIFRGQANSEWPLDSSADRRLRELEMNDRIDYLTTRLIAPARAEGYGYREARELTDLELLAKLQHHGAATCLIDFTSNYHIALWFACQDHHTDGAVFVLNRGDVETFETIGGGRVHDGIEKLLTVDVEDDSQDRSVGEAIDPLIFCWTPPPNERRFIVQQSCFVFSQSDQLAEVYGTIRVAKEDKGNLLKSLQLYYGLEEQTIFRDLTGFAASQGVGGITVRKRTASEWFKIGGEYFQQREYVLAIEHYDRAINLMDPPSGSYYEQRGVAQSARREHLQAIDDFSAAISLDGANDKYFARRGRAYIRLREYEMAIRDLDRAIRLNRTNGSHYHARGNAKRRLGRYEEAIDDFQMIRELNEKLQYTSLFAQAMTRKEWGEKDPEGGQLEAAIEDLNEAIQGEEGRPRHSAYWQRAVINRALGRREEAVEDLRESRRLIRDGGETRWAPRARERQLERIREALEELGHEGESLG